MPSWVDVEQPYDFVLDLDLTSQVIEALREATEETSRRLIALARMMREGSGSIGPKLAELHAQVGAEAQRAVVARYEAARAAGRNEVPSYRVGTRYAGGALMRALTDPNFIVATEDGLVFGNKSILDANAKQWARLNFGVMPGAGAPSTDYAVRVSNMIVAAFGLDGDTARPAFRLPRGFWVTPGGYVVSPQIGQKSEMFFPAGEMNGAGFGGIVKNRRRMTKVTWSKGILAEHFLDEGVRVIAANLGDAYVNLYRTLYREARDAAKTGDVGVVRRFRQLPKISGFRGPRFASYAGSGLGVGYVPRSVRMRLGRI